MFVKKLLTISHRDSRAAIGDKLVSIFLAERPGMPRKWRSLNWGTQVDLEEGDEERAKRKTKPKTRRNSLKRSPLKKKAPFQGFFGLY